jgi:hypothetical protein
VTDIYNRPEQAVELRRRAEKIAQSSEGPESLSPEETREMLHELRVHQIELEMQNEELRRSQAELDAAKARYFHIGADLKISSQPGQGTEINLFVPVKGNRVKR